MPGQHESSSTMRVILPTEARMRGDDRQQAGMWSYLPLEQRVPPDHPLRPIRGMVDGVLAELSPEFGQLYSRVGRPSIAPEKLLRALLLQVLYTVRSERLLMEQLHYNLLFRWFVGLEMDDPVWDATVFTKNRERLLAGDVARVFFDRVLAQARGRGFLSDEHFTVDGTLIEAWASLKSFQRKDASPPPPDDPGNPTVNFHGPDQCDPCLDDGCRGAAVSEGQGSGSQAVLPRARVDGKPAWPRCRWGVGAGDRGRRAHGGPHDARAHPRHRARHRGRRQGV